MKDVLNLIISGVGGQGNVFASRLIVNVAMGEGYEVSDAEIYGASQRGGSVTSHVRLSDEGEYGPLIPEGGADVIVGFEPVETVKSISKFGSPDVNIILNPKPSSLTAITGRVMDYPDVDEIVEFCEEYSSELKVIEATEIAEELGASVVHNIVLVGCLIGSGWTPLSPESFEAAIEETFSGENVELNLKALEKGIEAAEE